MPRPPARAGRSSSPTPRRALANQDDDALVLFGYVVEELRKANLPTEFALIPFVESGYRPNARNGSGPTGLWQFIATTARNHRVPMANGTTAACRRSIPPRPQCAT